MEVEDQEPGIMERIQMFLPRRFLAFVTEGRVAMIDAAWCLPLQMALLISHGTVGLREVVWLAAI